MEAMANFPPHYIDTGHSAQEGALRRLATCLPEGVIVSNPRRPPHRAGAWHDIACLFDPASGGRCNWSRRPPGQGEAGFGRTGCAPEKRAWRPGTPPLSGTGEAAVAAGPRTRRKSTVPRTTTNRNS